jgi:rubrerythrin
VFEYPAIYGRFPANQAFLNDLAKAVNGEYSAIACYERLARLAPDEETRSRIMEIRQDEIRHYQQFARFYYQLSGRQPVPQMSDDCPDEYGAGLLFAFKDEQNTVDFYLDIADKAADPVMREAFRRAAADEQSHAVWFQHFIMQRR